MCGKTACRCITGVVAFLFVSTVAARAASIPVTGSPLFVSAADAAGTSFTYDGTIRPTDTISFSVSGIAYLQDDPAFGTNAAGVILVAGDKSGEVPGAAVTRDGSKIPQGALEIEVNGFGPAVFKANAANGLGSSDAPQTLVFTGTLGSIFGQFTPVTDPTFTFLVMDRPGYYGDNSGGFTVTNISAVPVPAAAWQSLAGLVGVGVVIARKKLTSAV